MFTELMASGSGGGSKNILMLLDQNTGGLVTQSYYDEDLLEFVSGSFQITGKSNVTFTSKVNGSMTAYIIDGDSSGGASLYVNGTMVANVSASPYKTKATNIPISVGDTLNWHSTAYYGGIVLVLE